MEHSLPAAVEDSHEVDASDLIVGIRNGLDALVDDTDDYQVSFRVGQARDAVDNLLAEGANQKQSHMRAAEEAIQRASTAADGDEKVFVDLYWDALMTYKQRRRSE